MNEIGRILYINLPLSGIKDLKMLKFVFNSKVRPTIHYGALPSSVVGINTAAIVGMLWYNNAIERPSTGTKHLAGRQNKDSVSEEDKK